MPGRDQGTGAVLADSLRDGTARILAEGDARRGLIHAERLKKVVVPLALHLRASLTVEMAHDLLLALSIFEVYRELRGRGWSDAGYQTWLGEILRHQLLGSGPRFDQSGGSRAGGLGTSGRE